MVEVVAVLTSISGCARRIRVMRVRLEPGRFSGRAVWPASIPAFFWRITRHNTLAALADLYPQWLVRDLLPPAAKRRHSSRGNKIAQPAILR
ncbi:hypothetical protein [Bradyrhizobium zhanjiangense]|uniref:hypothetical protein n=1 Tax=Bradyrhizobium zhanjiangense TaxID=1325107 RepID=UPI001008934C|nr:hypothetical protein [Bradyrhizobium zhanjiangense]